MRISGAHAPRNQFIEVVRENERRGGKEAQRDKSLVGAAVQELVTRKAAATHNMRLLTNARVFLRALTEVCLTTGRVFERQRRIQEARSNYFLFSSIEYML